MWHLDFSELLRQTYKAKAAKNTRYSLRGYAKKLGVSISTISNLMNNKTTVTLERAIDILEKMDISEEEKRKFLMTSGVQTELPKQELPKEAYALLQDWTLRIILFFHDVKSAKKTAAFISENLKLDIATVEKSLAILCQNGFLTRDAEGITHRLKCYYTTTDEIENDFVKNLHKSSLQAAENSLESISLNERDFSSLLFVGSQEEVDFLKKEIRHLFDKVVSRADAGARDKLLQLSICLHPAQGFQTKDIQ